MDYFLRSWFLHPSICKINCPKCSYKKPKQTVKLWKCRIISMEWIEVMSNACYSVQCCPLRIKNHRIFRFLTYEGPNGCGNLHKTLAWIPKAETMSLWRALPSIIVLLITMAQLKNYLPVLAATELSEGYFCDWKMCLCIPKSRNTKFILLFILKVSFNECIYVNESCGSTGVTSVSGGGYGEVVERGHHIFYFIFTTVPAAQG